MVAAPASAGSFPKILPLPNGFQPEGIAIGPRHTFYVGSIPTGAVYRGDLRTGAGSVLVPGRDGRAAVGLELDRRGHLFVAGGPTGKGFVYDAATGADIVTYQLAPGQPTFINDVVVTRDAAWFTDSMRAVLYRVPIAPNGTLGGQADVQTVPLTGDFQLQPGFNANGIEATPNGKRLIVVQSNTGLLFSVDPATGVASTIDLGGATLTNGDGILLLGRTLYVVRNVLNRVAVLRLSPDLSSGILVGEITDPSLDVPTTIDRFGSRLYAVNARFSTPPSATTEYWVTRLPRR